MQQIDRAVQVVRERVSLAPQVAIILGSGLGALAGEVRADAVVPYVEIPGFPRATVEGHAGNLLVGQSAGRGVAVMQGRAHFYDGDSLADVIFPVLAIRALRARDVQGRTAAGGINR